MITVVTGGYGFIGSNLVNELLQNQEKVIVLDNLTSGDVRFLQLKESKNLYFYKLDLANTEPSVVAGLIDGADTVYHLAANADVRNGFNSRFRDIESNILATHVILEAALHARVKNFIFASTGCVYGDTETHPTSEDSKFPIQTSLYGASKVAAEGLVSSYALNGTFKATTFRFVSVLGPNYHHGHIIDFLRQLSINPLKLEILGNGRQRKSYIHVKDCIRAMMTLRGDLSYEVFNIGHLNYISVLDSAMKIAAALDLKPEYAVGEEKRGWIGDNPFTFLDISKAQRCGWNPTISLEDSILDTVRYLKENNWLLKKSDYRLP